MPNRATTRASGSIDPSEGLSFSGAVVVQQQSFALKQTSDTATFQGPAGAPQSTETNPDTSTGDPLSGTEQSTAGFSAGLLSPLESPIGVTSSSAAENAAPDDDPADGEGTEDEGDEDADENGTSTATASPDGCDTSVSNLYCVYTVQEGDLLSSIADRFGLTSTENFVNWELLVRSNNSVVVDPDAVAPGLKMIIPRGNGVIHTVLTSQTLTEIAGQYGVTVEEIMAVPGNGISNPDSVGIGTEMLIPNPVQFAPTFVPDEAVESEDEDESAAEDTESTEETADDTSEDTSEDSSGDSSGSDSSGDITGGGATSGSGFSWPISGPISSYYGPNHPLGIDIDLFGRAGAPVSAAMGGVVTFAGGNACCSYGYYVVVDHGNGFQTLYAHLSSIGVSMGEVVAGGQYLGGAGTTGYSTGVHLHFELQSGGSRVNPLNYLP